MFVRNAIFLLCLGVTCGAGAAESVLLSDGNLQIDSQDLRADALRMPPEMRPLVLSRPQTVGQIATNLYVRRAMAAKAQTLGLDKDPQVLANLKIAADKVLSDALLEHIDKENALSEQALLAKAQSLYKAKPERFQSEEQVHARHILIAGNSPESKAEAEKVLSALKAGANFADLAKEKSADKSNAAKGGDLGFFGRGRMVPSFEQAAFALKNKNDLSPVVESQFGYHVIQLEARKPAGLRPFDEVKDDLVKEVRTTIAQDARVAEAQRIQSEAKLDTQAIEAFAKSYEAAAGTARKSGAPTQ